MRSMVVTRSLFRRAYFLKTFKDNKQVLLMQMKQRDHRMHCARTGDQNDFTEEAEDMEDLSKGGALIVAPEVQR